MLNFTLISLVDKTSTMVYNSNCEVIMIRQQLAEIFNYLREDSGKTFKQVCEEGGLCNKQIVLISKGEGGISIEKIEKVIKDVFNVDILLTI